MPAIRHPPSSQRSKASKSSPSKMAITEFQEKIYTHLLLIPSGRLTTYAMLSKLTSSSPRAVGGALRTNPFAPQVPCHRVIASSGYVGGYKGDWENAPSGINQSMKLDLLRDEGIQFDGQGKLVETQGVWFEGPWDLKQGRAELERYKKQVDADKQNLRTKGKTKAER